MCILNSNAKGRWMEALLAKCMITAAPVYSFRINEAMFSLCDRHTVPVVAILQLEYIIRATSHLLQK